MKLIGIEKKAINTSWKKKNPINKYYKYYILITKF